MKTRLALNTVIVTILLFTFAQCKKECVEVQQPNCFSTKEYNPVCGCNGKTYDNPSHALCAGITRYCAGACK